MRNFTGFIFCSIKQIRKYIFSNKILKTLKIIYYILKFVLVNQAPVGYGLSVLNVKGKQTKKSEKSGSMRSLGQIRLS